MSLLLSLEVESGNCRWIRIELILVAIRLRCNSGVLLLATKVLLDHIKDLLIYLYILV